MFNKRKIDIIKDKLKKKIKNADKQKRPNILKQLKALLSLFSNLILDIKNMKNIQYKKKKENMKKKREKKKMNK